MACRRCRAMAGAAGERMCGTLLCGSHTAALVGMYAATWLHMNTMQATIGCMVYVGKARRSGPRLVFSRVLAL